MKTTRKKYRIVAPVRFTAIVTTLVLICVFAFSSMTGMSNASGAQIPEYRVVRVQSGDTLWQIAKDYGPANQDIRQTVYEICKINDTSASQLQAGQQIYVPVE